MNRMEFVMVTATVLFVAFLLGWFAAWIIHRVTRVTQADMGELDRMARALHEAEETRDEAITYMQQREAELTNKLTETEAELHAATEALDAARKEAEARRGPARQQQGHLAGT